MENTHTRFKPARRPSDRENRRAIAKRVCAIVILAGSPTVEAAPRYFDHPDEYATRRVAAYLASKDCPGAVNALNEGVKAKQRDVLLLAGTMFETGLCVKENWDKAAQYYQLADAAGNRSAIHRLAAGFAAAGRDNAVALWWAAHRPRALPPACIPAADPETDLDAFEAALKNMPPVLFKACVYMTGVYSAMMAETEFPAAARLHEVYGDIDMEFNPAQGTITWHQESHEQARGEGLRDGNKFELEDRRKIDNSLLTYMRETGRRTLSRYQRPEGIPPEIRIRQKFSFHYK